jgi:hypothetical protein
MVGHRRILGQTSDGGKKLPKRRHLACGVTQSNWSKVVPNHFHLFLCSTNGVADGHMPIGEHEFRFPIDSFVFSLTPAFVRVVAVAFFCENPWNVDVRCSVVVVVSVKVSIVKQAAAGDPVVSATGEAHRAAASGAAGPAAGRRDQYPERSSAFTTSEYRLQYAWPAAGRPSSSSSAPAMQPHDSTELLHHTGKLSRFFTPFTVHLSDSISNTLRRVDFHEYSVDV